MQKIKKIPYGTTDFKKIQEQDYYYIDKTKYIEIVEDSADFLFLIRPRRFGKSLFLATLQSYYDVYFKNDFEHVFKNTYIGANPTPEKSKYLMLSFNFAMIDSKIENTEESFELHCKMVYSLFLDKYETFFDEKQIDSINQQNKSSLKFLVLLKEAQKNNLRIYIIIDEYDNFTNSILARYGVNNYKKVVGETSFLKHFFNVIKGGTTGSNSPIAKFFITGVSPITLDDITSGAIGFNITTAFQFNEIVGFTETEVVKLLEYYRDAGKINTDINIILKFMKKWYNNYKFSRNAKQNLFNSTMVLNFIARYMQDFGFPIQTIDDNTKIDYTKLRHLLILDKKLNGNFSVLNEILEQNQITAILKPAFSINKITNRDNFISLLYYFGLITIVDFKNNEHIFKIPNETIKEFFSIYIKDGYEEANIFKLDIYKYNNLIKNMAYQGEWKSVFQFLSKAIKEQSRIRDYIKGEHMIKGFLLAYLNLTNDFIITSEKELNKGNADLWIAPFVTPNGSSKYSYLVELKYNKRTETEKIDTKKLVAKAKIQLNKYEKDPIILEEKESTIVKKIVLIYNAWELIHIEEIK